MYAIAIVLFALTAAIAQSKPDENGIHGTLDEEIANWNQSEADGYSTFRH